MKNAVVTATAISVRTGRGVKYSKLGEFKSGNAVVVLDDELNQDYARVVWAIGYAYSSSGKYIKFTGSKTTVPNAVVTANEISVRKGRSQSYSRLGLFKKNDSVTVLDGALDQAYAKVIWQEGYAYSKNGAYLKFESAGSVAPAQPNAEVTASRISVRKGRGQSYAKLGEFKKGDKIYVLDDKLDKAYAHVVFGGGDSYAYSNNGAHIRFTGAASEPVPEEETAEKQPSAPNAVVTANEISVRRGRGQSFAKLGSLKKGNNVIVLDEALDQAYAHIVFGSGDGYAYSSNGAYIRFLTVSPSLPASEAVKKTLDAAAGCVGGKYIFGAQGTKITQSYVKKQAAKHPEYFTGGRYDYLLSIGKRCDESGVWRFPADYAWDCSGLWWYCANKAGIYGKNLDSTAHTFYHTYCAPVSKAELKAGDAVFYKNSSGRVTHMGIVGPGGVVFEAMSGYTGVVKGDSVDDRTAPRIVGSGNLKRSAWNLYGRPKIFK